MLSKGGQEQTVVTVCPVVDVTAIFLMILPVTAPLIPVLVRGRTQQRDQFQSVHNPLPIKNTY